MNPLNIIGENHEDIKNQKFVCIFYGIYSMIMYHVGNIIVGAYASLRMLFDNNAHFDVTMSYNM